MYLDNVVNFEQRKQITKLRLGCSKLQTHCFLSKIKPINVNTVRKETEDLTHLLINCSEYNCYRNKFYESNKNISITFQFMPVNIVSSILYLNSPIKLKKVNNTKFQNFCIDFIECLNKHRLSVQVNRAIDNKDERIVR